MFFVLQGFLLSALLLSISQHIQGKICEMLEFPATPRITSVNYEFHDLQTMTEQFQLREWGHY
jgi:hypothetical protein